MAILALLGLHQLVEALLAEGLLANDAVLLLFLILTVRLFILALLEFLGNQLKVLLCTLFELVEARRDSLAPELVNDAIYVIDHLLKRHELLLALLGRRCRAMLNMAPQPLRLLAICETLQGLQRVVELSTVIGF